MSVNPEHLLILYQRHLVACGLSEDVASKKTEIPGSRFDLLEHYTGIMTGKIPCPPWAEPLPNGLFTENGVVSCLEQNT